MCKTRSILAICLSKALVRKFIINKQIRPLIYGCLAVIIFAVPAQASTTLLSFDPINIYGGHSWAYGRIASKMTMPTTATSPFLLETLEINIAYSAGTTPLMLSIWADAGTGPGALLASQLEPDIDDGWNAYDIESLGFQVHPGESIYVGYSTDYDSPYDDDENYIGPRWSDASTGSIVGVSYLRDTFDYSKWDEFQYDWEIKLTVRPVANFAETIHVDAFATGANDGSSWDDAYNYLQDALAVASVGDEIRIADGIYRPDEDTANPTGTGDRRATFQLVNGVKIYGGYAGFGEIDPDDRDVKMYESILSGDLNGDDIGFANNGENSYHVVSGIDTNIDTVIDGFTITSGNANGEAAPIYENSGGGVFAENNGNFIILNCRISQNWARSFGGGMYLRLSNATVNNCTFGDNATEGYGGGAMVYSSSNPDFGNCAFTANLAGDGGGGLEIFYESNPSVTNCIFTGNHTSRYGGGIRCGGQNDPVIVNCTLSGNSAGTAGGGIYAGSINGGTVTATNCILWGDMAPTGPEIALAGYSLVITHSDVEGGWPGEYNIDADPLFVSGPLGDYYISQMAAGQGDDSPCIDAGSDSASVLELDTFTTRTDHMTDIGLVDIGYHYAPTECTIDVAIDIKPGSYPNAVNLGSLGLIPVAILSSEEFDATSVDPESVELGGAGVEVRGKSNKFMAHEEDVDADGLVDLVVLVATENLDPGAFQDGYAVLSGKTHDDVPIEGVDEITIVPRAE